MLLVEVNRASGAQKSGWTDAWQLKQNARAENIVIWWCVCCGGGGGGGGHSAHLFRLHTRARKKKNAPNWLNASAIFCLVIYLDVYGRPFWRRVWIVYVCVCAVAIGWGRTIRCLGVSLKYALYGSVVCVCGGVPSDWCGIISRRVCVCVCISKAITFNVDARVIYLNVSEYCAVKMYKFST